MEFTYGSVMCNGCPDGEGLKYSELNEKYSGLNKNNISKLIEYLEVHSGNLKS